MRNKDSTLNHRLPDIRAKERNIVFHANWPYKFQSSHLKKTAQNEETCSLEHMGYDGIPRLDAQ